MPRRLKWDETTIAATLGQVVAELGRMPTRTELERLGLSSLWSAMRRHGGTRVWAARAVAATAEPVAGDLAAAAEPPATTEERIRLRAYFLALDGAPGGPQEHWLRAEREIAA
jgi:DUF2934 family protein